MREWSPITDDEFNSLFDSQYHELNDSERAAFNAFRVRPWKATIRRSEMAGDEAVFVVAELPAGCALYFDDVEFGFNVSNTIYLVSSLNYPEPTCIHSDKFGLF